MTIQGQAARRALVTGGAGFIGGHITERLVRDGWQVRVLDDFSTGRDENLAACADEVEVIRGDLCDESALKRAIVGVDVVFHEGAIASVPRSVHEPVVTQRVNLEGTLRVLEAVRNEGVRRIVFAASSAAYGNGETLPKREDLPAEFLSPYALQKFAGEQLLALYSELHGVETVALRYFNVFGPRQDPKSDYAAVIPLFIDAALRGHPVKINGDGLQTRDFVFIDDVVRANLLAATADLSGGLSGRVYNVASGRRTSILDLVRGIERALGREIAVEHGPPREGDVRHSWADVSRIRDAFGFEAQVDLEEGLARTAGYFRTVHA